MDEQKLEAFILRFEKSLVKLEQLLSPVARENSDAIKQDAVTALVQLGFKKKDAEAKVKTVLTTTSEQTLEVILRESLKQLCQK